LVTRESQNPDDNATVWRVHDEPQPPGPDLPKTLVGYVEVNLEHRRGDARPADCPEEYEEVRSQGHFVHFQEGEGDWNGVSIGAGLGPLSVSFAPETKPGQETRASTGVLALHSPSGGAGGRTTNITYTGPRSIRFNQPFTASARLTATQAAPAASTAVRPAARPMVRQTVPVPNVPIQFILGFGGKGQSCTDTTDSNGVAACVLTPRQQAGPTTLTIRYPGDDGHAASNAFVAFTIEHQLTKVSYTGPKRLANGRSVRLSGVLREQGGAPIAGRRLRLAVGSGSSRQTCTGTTDSSGRARCTIDSVDQPLNKDATVPVSVAFGGDDFYLASSTSATALLEYYTGRAYGLTAHVALPGLLSADLPPAPDTGGVRVARASESATGCIASVSTLLLDVDGMCPHVTTSLAPGTSQSTASVQHATIGLPGLPVIEIEGATARSTSTCANGGSATGTTDLRLRIGGDLVQVNGEANAVVDLPGVAKLVINEQIPVRGAEHGLTVNAVHLTAIGGTDIIIGSARSDVHNCVAS